MKKVKVNLLIILVLILTMVIIPCNVHAASFSASASTSLQPGNTTKLSITTSDCAGKFTVSSSNSSVVSVSASSTFVDGSTMTPEITLTANGEGTATITVTASDVLDSSYNEITGSKTVNITVKAPAQTPTTPPPSGGNTGSNSGGGTSSGTTTPTAPTFTSVSKTVYATGDINLRASWSTSSAATTVPKGTELLLTGTSTQTVNGYVWYRVTYNGQIKYVSKNLITETKPEEEKKSSNANLKTLSIEGVELTPEFSSDVTAYSVKLVNDEESLKITAEPEDTNSTVKIEGNDKLALGENAILITVTAQDGSTKVYTITATKDEKVALGLQSLKINGKVINELTVNKFEYKVEFSGLDKLEIEAVANQEGATVEILGNENLAEGENTITIIVTSKDGEETATYQIKANKLVTSNQQENRELNMKNILICALIALILIVVIVILIVKYIKNKENSNINYVYTDNLDDKKDEEIADEITPEVETEKEEKKTTVDDLFAKEDDDSDYKPRRRGKHSK